MANYTEEEKETRDEILEEIRLLENAYDERLIAYACGTYQRDYREKKKLQEEIEKKEKELEELKAEMEEDE